MFWRKEKRKDKLKREGSSAGEIYYSLSIEQVCEKLHTSTDNGKLVALVMSDIAIRFTNLL